MGAKLHLVGERFGRLVVVGEGSHVGKSRAWRCLCDCGAQANVTTGQLRTNGTKSCGCATIEATVARSTKHGMAHRGERGALYTTWKGMRQRCNDPKATNYRYYGGRGIKVCREWDDFATFHSWALHSGYAAGLTLDRERNNEGYSPSNCRWVTRKVQMKNTRVAHHIQFLGEDMNKREVAAAIGAKYTTLVGRSNRIGIEAAIEAALAEA